MFMPRVSAVIPTFGRPQLLKRAVDSVLAQTMADLELIVVVDGPDAPTIAFLEQVGDARLRVVVHPGNRGPGQARNSGAEAAKGEWVAFLDDDDEWFPEKLERQLASAPAMPAIVMALSRVQKNTGSFIKPDAPYDGRQPLDEWLFGSTGWLKGRGSFLQTSSLMVPRALFDTLKFRPINMHEDWEFVLRAVKQHGLGLVTTPAPLLIHYVDDSRASLSKTLTWRIALDWIRGLGDLITPRAYAAFCLTVAGRSAANVKDFSAFFPLLRTAFRDGRPAARDVYAYLLAWCMPTGLRHRLRARLQGERRPQAA